MIETIAIYCGLFMVFMWMISMLFIQSIKLCVHEFDITQDDIQTYLDKLMFPLNIAKIMPTDDYFEIKRVESLQIIIFSGAISSFLVYALIDDFLRTNNRQEQIYFGLLALFAVYTIFSIIRGLYGLTKGKSHRKRK